LKNQLARLAVDGWVYLEICKGMYGLKQAGILANKLLQKRLKPFGYHPAIHTPGLWLYTTKPTAFSLVVDNFAVKYVTNTSQELTRIIYEMRCYDIMKSQRTGVGQFILELH
jgi:hypothetical protein